MSEPDFISRKDGQSNEIEFYGDLKRETDLAYCFYDGIDYVWLPKSQIIEIEQVTTATYRVLIPEWLAKAKEII